MKILRRELKKVKPFEKILRLKIPPLRNFLLKISIFEISILSKILSKNDFFVDVGAGVGKDTIFASSRCKRVFSFEPNPYVFEKLEKNCKRLGLNNVVLVQKAVGEKNKKIRLNVPNKEIKGTSSIHKKLGDSVNVEMVKLSPFSTKIKNPDIIKIDIEGSEFSALKGMKKMLKENNIDILCEIHIPLLKKQGTSKKNLIKFMRKLGYKYYKLGENVVSLKTEIAFFSKEKNTISGFFMNFQKKCPFRGWT